MGLPNVAIRLIALPHPLTLISAARVSAVRVSRDALTLTANMPGPLHPYSVLGLLFPLGLHYVFLRTCVILGVQWLEIIVFVNIRL